MQPMHRPVPPHGMRPPGAPHSSFPSGLPPPQRPPAGYRPSFPMEMQRPGPPTSEPPSSMIGNMPSAPNPMMKPPIQQMAAMNINNSTTHQQFLSNGVADNERISSQQQSFNVNKSKEAIGNPPFSSPSNNDQNTQAEAVSSSGLPSAPMSEPLEQIFQQKESIQDPFLSSQNPSGSQIPPSQSPSISQSHPLSKMDTNFGSQMDSQNSNDMLVGSSNSSVMTSGISSSGNMGPLSVGAPQTATPATPTSFMNHPGPPNMATQPGYEPSKPSITQTNPYINSAESNLSSTSSSQFSMPSPNLRMSQSIPSVQTQNSPLGQPRFGVMQQTPQMGIPRPGLSPNAPSLGPQRPNMPPMSSQMGPSQPGFASPSSQMPPPRPGLSPMGPPGGNLMRPQSGMPSTGFPGGSVAPPFRMPPSSNVPPSQGSFPISPQSDMHTTRPGMPPPPSSSYMASPNMGMAQPPPPTSTFMASPNAGMPPPPVSSQMSTGGTAGMPPTPSSMGNYQGMPGMGGMQNRYPGASPAGGSVGGYPQGSQGRRLNPDDMPSPLQVIEEDKQTKSGDFFTSSKGGLPPLVTTDFIVKDNGNASPRFIRSTMYSVPATQDMMKQCSVPFGLIISPLAELHHNEAPIYLGTSLENGPVRCNRCKGYMSPLMVFLDGGRRYQCLLCKQINEVPADYYSRMDSHGSRADKYQRPELCLGAYEFIATPEYCKDRLLPKEPAFIFVMEMSQMMLQRGIISLLCQNMKSLLAHLPKDEVPGQEVTKSSIHVGFITYDSSVHFYKLTGKAPEMCVVCDKNRMFVPFPDGILCDIEEVSENVDRLMETIPQNFQTTRENSGALYSAIQAGMSALRASGRAGKLFVFHSSLPQTEGVGKLKNREDRKLLGTEKEKIVLSPQATSYNEIGQDLVNVGCGVDLFIFNENYVDLATIGQVSRLTGGQVYKYTYFQPNKDSERLLDDLRLNISRNIAFDAIMRVRTSTGVRPVDFFGHFFMTNTQDIELGVIDSSKAVAVEIKHDDKITEEDGVYIQCALLFTSVGGQRRLRILNLALNICTQMADMYKSCELDTLMNFFGKQAMFKFLDNTAKLVKENLISKTAQILACYRKNCATPSSAGQLILPEQMKLLPLYINSLTKCDALSGGQDMNCDDRSWHIYMMSTMNVESSVVYFYPRLIPLTGIDPQEVEIPPPVRTSYEKLSPDGVYLLENGLFMFMWVGSGTPSSWMKDVFGVSAPHQLDPVLAELPDLDNPVSKRVRGIIEAIRDERKLHVRLFVVPQQGKHEVVMRNYLVEDKGMVGSPSYVDFLCHVHKEIRALLS